MSFFKKIKGDMGIELEENKKEKKVKKVKIEKSKIEPKSKQKTVIPEKEKDEPEGQLAIDVYETEEDLVIQSTIAGVKAEDLDISVENDLVKIRGSRQKPINNGEEKKYLYQECYWGPFSRKIILPEEVDSSKVEAKMKDGVLTLKMPKIQRKKKRKITVKQGE